jgi:hypothetical protein
VRTHSLVVIVLATLVPAAAAALVRAADADHPTPSRAARSVHLHYAAPDGTLFYNEATVEQSQRGSYFCACGFRHGYFGIQELDNGKKVVLFSVWDPGDRQNPNEVEQEKRVELLYKGDGVRAGRFGGEGTGGQSFFDYPWKTGETCRFLVRATVEGDKTAFAAYFAADGTDGWKHLATFRTMTKGSPLKGYYSFVEDFRRDRKSPNERRLERYGNGWVKTTAGDWVSLCRARFTGDNTPLDNIDAGVRDTGFYLATGGDTTASRPLNSLVERTPAGVTLPQFDDAPATRPARDVKK